MGEWQNRETLNLASQEYVGSNPTLSANNKRSKFA